MGANGNRKQTLRSNIVQPYEAGLLAATDHKDYNAVMGMELDKISTSTKHMFQGLDDLRTEVDERTKALDALHLTVNDQFNRVTMEIAGVKQQIGQGITIDTITDADGNILSGVLQGLKTDVQAANGNISVILGEIVNTNTKFDGEITRVEGKADAAGTSVQTINGILYTADPATGGQTRIAKTEAAITAANNTISNTTQLVNTINANGTNAYKAQWDVKSNVNGLQRGVGFVNDGAQGVFTVNADVFKFTGGGGGNASIPFYIQGDKAYIKNGTLDTARIKFANIDNVSITNGQINDSLYSKNWSDGKQGWFLNQDGTLSITGNSGDGNNRAVFDSNGLSVIRNGVEVFRAGLL